MGHGACDVATNSNISSIHQFVSAQVMKCWKLGPMKQIVCSETRLLEMTIKQCLTASSTQLYGETGLPTVWTNYKVSGHSMSMP